MSRRHSFKEMNVFSLNHLGEEQQGFSKEFFVTAYV